jgi:archaellum component FlaD/FlaE
VRRLAAWWRYRRRLAALLAVYEELGYPVSPRVYEQLQAHARAISVSLETEKGA